MAKRMANTQSANLTLGGMILGFVFSYPFHAGFVGGLISSGCSAGMIGGLADWFAVTALFRRPLGIRSSKVLRTEIIPQNRERIFSALADMVQNELLSQDVLRRKLSAWDFSGVLIRIFADQDVRNTVNLLLAKLVEDSVFQPESEEFRQQIQSLLQENWGKLNLSKTLVEIIEFSLKHGNVDQALTVICRTIYEFMDQSVVSTALTNIMEEALNRYMAKNSSRKLVGMFLPSPAVLAQGLGEKVKTALQDGTVAQWLKDYLLRFVLELKTKPSVQENVNRFFLAAFQAGMQNSEVKEKPSALIEWLWTALRNNWEGYLERVEQDSQLRRKIDEGVKGILQKQIEYHHNVIGRMVREGLEPLTDDLLVELIEDKVGNDLQMIRINGTVVGGLAGMLIYVLTWVWH